ncbi:expressed unknown protein [Seminavis robusta]|uniref:Uncharacterized protein n=1 Tax=Seminavis robusta TaxID=568900 RepID=A0A9N8EZQ3_9STRA|nr:expressed unknown protein [Seminavis robusta]|eukprot:Sro2122_g315520.1 n/a (120) ;mRNA; f:12672-13031
MKINHVSSPSPQPRSGVSMARSQPIAIAKGDADWGLQELDMEREECEKRFYESATWRMYTRIVDHRLNSPDSQSPAPVHYNNGSPSPCSVGSSASPVQLDLSVLRRGMLVLCRRSDNPS